MTQEEVLKGLECCTKSRQTIKPNRCDECPYKNKGVMNAFTVWKSCTNFLAEDALYIVAKQQREIEWLKANPNGFIEKCDRRSAQSLGR